MANFKSKPRRNFRRGFGIYTGMTTKNDTKISKLLSLVLRHKPEAIGISLDAQGWTPIDKLLRACKSYGRPFSREDLQRVVDNNDKQRYAISENGRMIRANQGHSVQIDHGYAPTTPPEFLYHGTATRFLDSIFQTGLDKQKRHHVHLSENLETATKVGSRHGQVIVLRVAAGELATAGHVFYRSENGVWLTERVPVAYFSIVG